MPKVAYLTGVPGAGKTFISRHIMEQKLAQFIIGDEVRKRTIQILCPNVVLAHVWNEDLWDSLSAYCHIQPAMDASVNGYVFPSIDLQKPLLVDAYLTSHGDFREAFSKALERGGYEIEAERLFWIDTPLETVVRQANLRIRNGERPGESHINLEVAQRRRNRIEQRVKHAEFSKAVNTDDMTQQIAKFLK